MSGSARAPWSAALDVSGVTILTLAIGANAFRLAGAIGSATDLLIILAVFPLGALVADILAGTVHWFCDTFFEEDTPVIGPTFIYSFREHHRDPSIITKHNFLELNGSTCLVAGIAALASLAIDPRDGGWRLAEGSFLFSLCFFGAITNQLHRWAHEASPPRLARVLHRAHLVLTPEHHRVHHTAPFARHYCVTNGWANGLLERLSAWRHAERLAVSLGIPKGRE
jgi:ubiquitin-conjugating enzyme E2 variant